MDTNAIDNGGQSGDNNNIGCDEAIAKHNAK
jgi:hypothetical protein